MWFTASRRALAADENQGFLKGRLQGIINLFDFSNFLAGFMQNKFAIRSTISQVFQQVFRNNSDVLLFVDINSGTGSHEAAVGFPNQRVDVDGPGLMIFKTVKIEKPTQVGRDTFRAFIF